MAKQGPNTTIPINVDVDPLSYDTEAAALQSDVLQSHKQSLQLQYKTVDALGKELPKPIVLVDEFTNINVSLTQREWAFICFVRAFGTGTLEVIDVKGGAIEVVGSVHQRIDFSKPGTVERLFNAPADKIIVKA